MDSAFAARGACGSKKSSLLSQEFKKKKKWALTLMAGGARWEMGDGR
jgi:hypothetical protein